MPVAATSPGAPEPGPRTATTDPAVFGTKPYTPPAAGGDGGVRKIDQPAVEPVDLLDAAGAPVAKRAIPLALFFLALILLRRRRRRRRLRRRADA
jgi:hypothetical protein